VSGPGGGGGSELETVVPDRGIFEIDRYLSLDLVETGRGCYFNCRYCSTQLINGPKLRKRSPEKVGEEIDMIKRLYGITHFQIWDDTFTFEKDRLRELCVVLKKREVTFDCNTRPDFFTEEDAMLMKDSGCRNIFFGVESGNSEILNYLGRPMKKEKIVNSFRYAEKYGIRTTASFIIGSPIETEETLRETLDFAKLLKADHVLFNILTPHKGTRIYTLSVKKQLLKPYDVDIEKFPHEPIGVPMVDNINGLDRDDINRWKMEMYKNYYLRLGYMSQQLRRTRSLDDIIRIFKLWRIYKR